jgi:hypothetical protein
MTYRSPEQVEQQYLETCGPELGPLINRLVGECTRLHWKWGDYVELFGKSPERIELLNRASGSFFRLVQDTLWEDVLLHIARLTDHAKSAGKDNLTLRRLPDLVAPEVRAETQALLGLCLHECEFARDWRMRHLAHRDLSLAIGTSAKPLAHASRLAVRTALDSIAKLLNAVEGHYLKSELAFDLGQPEGAVTLLYVIRDGLDAGERRRERLLSGKPEAGDIGPPPAV